MHGKEVRKTQVNENLRKISSKRNEVKNNFSQFFFEAKRAFQSVSTGTTVLSLKK